MVLSQKLSIFKIVYWTIYDSFNQIKLCPVKIRLRPAYDGELS